MGCCACKGPVTAVRGLIRGDKSKVLLKPLFEGFDIIIIKKITHNECISPYEDRVTFHDPT